MPQIKVHSLETVEREIEKALKKGIGSFIIFGSYEEKDPEGRTALKDSAAYLSIKKLKKTFKEDIIVIADVCLCGYTTHGHCGILMEGKLDHERSAEMLGKVAAHYAEAGADIVAPSAMVNHQVKAIRENLLENGFKNTVIMAYSAKYASGFYGPFREAVSSAPSFGDRKAYQMHFLNKKEALIEVEQSIEEGASIVMVKPALPYLDVINYVSERIDIPLAAFNVSGEYSMIMNGIKSGFFTEQIILEVIGGIFRAGASIVITYHALQVPDLLEKM